MFLLLIIACIALMLSYILHKTGIVTILPFYVLVLVIFVLFVIAYFGVGG